MADARFITFETGTPRLAVTAFRGNAPPQRTGGVGGWDIVPRPRREAITVFSGVEPRQQSISVILGVRPGPGGGHGVADGGQLDIPCTRDCNDLERMGRPPAPGAEPPIIRVIGAVAHSDIPWVIATNGLDWATDDTVMYSDKGFVTRQPVTVHLLEYVASDRLQAGSNAAQQARDRRSGILASLGAGAAPGTAGTYIIAATDLPPFGHGLDTIAAKTLGSYKRASELAALNGIRDGRRLAVGQRIRLR